ncbi:uncharacterized protein LOC116417429 [Nasonia vitripennis]|uniref:Uncharacterized protein n=1 Tax=Nasonia vitripennis TaxID=7425 RepID=A0A7M7TA61_NASVI|nr:uncharacterized protein LOC116417429 [Nasonia vitripennis]
MHLTILTWILTGISITTAANVWVDTLTSKIARQIQPKNLFVYTSKANNIVTSKSDLLIQKVNQEIPVLTLDFKDVKRIRYGESLIVPERKLVDKDLELSLVLYHRDNDSSSNLQKLEGLLIDFTKAYGIFPRPRCLIIFFNNIASLKVEFESFLERAWSLKFLDLIVIEVFLNDKNIEDDSLYIYSYNPFFKIYQQEFFNETASIFPDKLVDLNGLEFIVEALH